MSQIVISKVDSGWWKVSSNKYSPTTTHNPHSSKGFTLLEMLITIAVIGIILAFANSPDLELSNAKKTFNNTLESLQVELSTLHNEAMNRNTTTRMVITNSSGIYTITTYYSSTPVTSCSSAGTWTQISSRPINVHLLYEITGTTAMANTCFYRDSSSSGGVLTISPITANSNLKTAIITVTIATGYLDVDVQ